MKNELLDKGIILPSGEIGKDKINLVAGAITQPFAEMVWVIPLHSSYFFFCIICFNLSDIVLNYYFRQTFVAAYGRK